MAGVDRATAVRLGFWFVLLVTSGWMTAAGVAAILVVAAGLTLAASGATAVAAPLLRRARRGTADRLGVAGYVGMGVAAAGLAITVIGVVQLVGTASSID